MSHFIHTSQVKCHTAVWKAVIYNKTKKYQMHTELLSKFESNWCNYYDNGKYEWNILFISLHAGHNSSKNNQIMNSKAHMQQ